MYCRNCGNELNEDQRFCPVCGTENGRGINYCASCGEPLIPGRDHCNYCGARIKPEIETVSSVSSSDDMLPEGKDKSIAILLAFFFGGAGLHCFYLGENRKGLVRLFSSLLFGLGAIFSLIDLFKIIFGTYIWDPEAYF